MGSGYALPAQRLAGVHGAEAPPLPPGPQERSSSTWSKRPTAVFVGHVGDTAKRRGVTLRQSPVGEDVTEVAGGPAELLSSCAELGEEVMAAARVECAAELRIGVPAWARQKKTRAQVLRVVAEMEQAWTERDRVPVADAFPEMADTAEAFKNGLMLLRPRHSGEWGAVLSAAPAFWNRVALHHLRFEGARRWYVVVFSLDGLHRLLVLHVPPSRFLSPAAALDHRVRQMTYRDDHRGRFAPGLRVSDKFMTLLSPEDYEARGRAYMTGGHVMDLVEIPPVYDQANYASYEEHGEKSLVDLNHQVAAGYLEGPLLYKPRIINKQAGIWDEVKQKYRPVVDCRRSGLNAAMRASTCSYDMLDDLLRVLGKGDWQSAFDFKDAFYMWPREQRFCDYQGLRGPRASPGIYRNRSLLMGGRDCPELQQGWANSIKEVVNRLVLLPLGRAQLISNGMTERQVLLMDMPEIAAMYVDDGKLRHPAAFTLEQAERQFAAVLAFFDEHGLQYSVKKNVWPARRGEYVGVALDTDTCVASVTEAKAARYGVALDGLVEEALQRGSVSRRALASVVGKLVWAAEVAPELRVLLAPCYWALQDFTAAPKLGAEWDPAVRVRLGADAIAALRKARAVLGDRRRLRRRWYPHEDQRLAGFWRGQIVDSHDYLDRHHRTSHGVAVCTGDASGDQGATVTMLDPLEGELREVWRYGPEESAPQQSSNYRELHTVLKAVELWGGRLAGRRVLVRSDNSTAVSVANRRGTNSANLLGLSERLVEECARHDVDLAAVHIPGEENLLADRLSRFKRELDQGDWMLDSAPFERARERARRFFGVEWTLDGSADPVGANRRLPRFCSAVNSILDMDLRGEQLYCNPDFELAEAVLRHFLQAYRSADVATSGTFVLPVWPDRRFWRLLKGAKVLDYYPAGTQLFTSPDWRQLQLTGGDFALGGQRRVVRGPTRWPVLIAMFPPLLSHRRHAGGAAAAGGVALAGGRSAAGGLLPTLRGEAQHDLGLLRGLRAGPLPAVRWAAASPAV